jgi:hypothetical protein
VNDRTRPRTVFFLHLPLRSDRSHCGSGGRSRPSRTAVVLAVFFLFSGVLAPIRPACGAGFTVLGLLAATETAKSAVSNLMADANADLKSAGGHLIGTLDSLTRELRNLVKNDLNQLVDKLTGAAYTVAQQLQHAVEDLEFVLERTVKCGLREINSVTASIKALALRAASDFPGGKEAPAELFSFQFAPLSRGVVSLKGGRVALIGYKLWSKGVAPLVTLTDEDRRPLTSEAEGEPSTGDDAVSMVVPPALLEQHAGGCLEFRVTPRHKRRLSGKIVNDTPLYVPMCVPRRASSRYFFTFSYQAVCSDQSADEDKDSTLLPHTFFCENLSCENKNPCNVEWTWTIPDGCEVIDLLKTPGALTRNNSQGELFTHQGGKVTGSATLDEASCILKKRYHSTVWQPIVSPVVHCHKSGQALIVAGTRPGVLDGVWRSKDFTIDSPDSGPFCSKLLNMCGPRYPPATDPGLNNPRDVQYTIAIYMYDRYGSPRMLGIADPTILTDKPGEGPPVNVEGGLRVYPWFNPRALYGSGGSGETATEFCVRVKNVGDCF